MECVLAGYRLYFLDHNNHIRHAVILPCETDSEAIAAVKEHQDGRTMELWDRDRMVKRFELPPDAYRPTNEPKS